MPPQTSSPASSSCFTGAKRGTACGTTLSSGCAHRPPAADMIRSRCVGLPWAAHGLCRRNEDHGGCHLHAVGSTSNKQQAQRGPWSSRRPGMQVRKFDGEMVWRRRHYRVRRAERPGTFFFSVLDNGVISSEFWRCALQLCVTPAVFAFPKTTVVQRRIDMQNVKSLKSLKLAVHT